MISTDMHTTDAAKLPSHKMQAYRTRMRASGLRPVQLWVPDIRSARLQEEARRQSLAVSGNLEQDTLEFIEEAADW
jgi:Protein  of unknown function (DUF3018)